MKRLEISSKILNKIIEMFLQKFLTADHLSKIKADMERGGFYCKLKTKLTFLFLFIYLLISSFNLILFLIYLPNSD